MQRFAFGTLVLVTAAMLARGASAADKLNIGDTAPEFVSLTGTDDKPHSLGDYKEAKAVVVVFTCKHCPVAQAYQERLVALQKDYKDKGVQVVAICSNKEDGLDKLKEQAEKAGFNFPYLCDETQNVGRDYGAKVTPHVFILDKDRKVVYKGAIDDDQNADSATKHYARAALDAVLDGKTPETATTRPVGCGIHYE